MEKLNVLDKPYMDEQKDKSVVKRRDYSVAKSIGRKVIGGLIVLFLLSPLFMTFLYSIFRDFTGIIPKGFTLNFYKEVIFGADSILPILGRTLLISFGPVLISMVIILLAVYASVVYFPKMDRVLNLVTKIPYSIQGIILAISLIAIYGNSSTFLANRILLLTFAYTVIISPYIYQGIKNALGTIDPLPILEAAEVLGASKFYAFFRLVVPALRSGLLATSLLAGGLLFGDFVLVNILAGSYYETMAIKLNRVMYYSGNQAAVISVILFIIMTLLSVYLNHLNHKKPGELSVFGKLMQRKEDK